MASIFARILLYFSKLIAWMKQHPELTLAGAVLVMIGSVVASNVIRNRTREVPETQTLVKQVETYRVGSSPKIKITGKVEKLNVITITAQGSGVVERIQTKSGATVNKGATLLSLATTYCGGNAASVSRQLAQKQYQQTQETYPIQKDLITKQREVADKTAENAEELRAIGQKSLDETRGQLELSESILTTLDENLRIMESATNAAQNASSILATKQLKSQYVAAVNQLKQTIRSAEYSSANDRPPADLALLQKEITLKQLDIQEKSLEIGKEIAALNVRLAQINESLFFPQAPFAGRIERIHVRVGQAVTPGMPLFTLSGAGENAQVVITADETIANNVSRLESSALDINGQNLQLTPTFISSEPTYDRLFGIVFALPDQIAATINDKDVIMVELPVGFAQTGNAAPFVPIEAVYQTQDQAYIFIVSQGSAQAVPVTLGQVFGRFVAVTGLPNDADIILTRTVLAGDPVEVLSTE